ncbi:MAG: hypothetical protein ACREPA_00610 [Candidatus Dormibacteraceae bacterium]
MMSSYEAEIFMMQRLEQVRREAETRRRHKPARRTRRTSIPSALAQLFKLA